MTDAGRSIERSRAVRSGSRMQGVVTAVADAVADAIRATLGTAPALQPIPVRARGGSSRRR